MGQGMPEVTPETSLVPAPPPASTEIGLPIAQNGKYAIDTIKVRGRAGFTVAVPVDSQANAWRFKTSAHYGLAVTEELLKFLNKQIKSGNMVDLFDPDNPKISVSPKQLLECAEAIEVFQKVAENAYNGVPIPPNEAGPPTTTGIKGIAHLMQRRIVTKHQGEVITETEERVMTGPLHEIMKK